MKKGEKKKLNKTLKKRIQDKLIRKRTQEAAPTSALYHIHQARHYPIEGCWAMRSWKENGLTNVVVARRQPNGNIAFGNYLVDYYCLGVKNAFCNAEIPRSEFRRDYLAKMFRGEKPLDISPALAHELIYGSIEYAAQFGFKPHRDFKLAQHVLDPADAHPRSGQVAFGKDGKPFFVAGPYDNADAIIRQLLRTAGADNFNYLVPIGPPDKFSEMDDSI